MKRLAYWWIAIAVFALTGCQAGAASSPQAPGQAVNPQAAPGPINAAAAPVSPSTLVKHVVKDAVQRQAVCNDGTPAVYYYHRGSGAEAARWLIHFEGGGWCGSDQACTERWGTKHDLMTSQGASNTLQLGGIFSTSEQQNPDFAHFTQVFVRYCSSDMYSGDGERQVGSQKLQFRGHQIVAAILQDLEDAAVIPGPNLKNATDVLVTGSSAGSFGAASILDWIAGQLPWANVKGVLDSSWVAPVPDYGSGPLGPQPGSADFYNYFPAIADESCAAANPSQPQICLSTLQLYPYLTTPVFIYADQRDPTLLLTKGLMNPDDPAAAAYVLNYSAALRASLKDVRAVFSPSVEMHTALTLDRFVTVKVDGHDFAELLGNWYFGRPGPVRLIAGEAP